MASNIEQDLLASWGVMQGINGEIVYQGNPLTLNDYWTSQPMPQTQTIDYSRLPMQFKPLILYQQQ